MGKGKGNKEKKEKYSTVYKEPESKELSKLYN